MDGGAWWAAVHGVARSWTWLSDFPFTFHSHALEKAMATHSSVLAWRIPGTGAWRAAVYGVAQSRIQLKQLSSSSSSQEGGEGRRGVRASLPRRLTYQGLVGAASRQAEPQGEPQESPGRPGVVVFYSWFSLCLFFSFSLYFSFLFFPPFFSLPFFPFLFPHIPGLVGSQFTGQRSSLSPWG